MKKIYIILAITLVFQFTLYSQGGDIHQRKKVVYVGANVTPAISMMSIDNSSVDASGSMGLQMGLEYGYYFSKSMGFSIGLGLSTYKSTLDLNDNTSFTSQQTDSEQETYDLTVRVNNYSEDFTAKTFDIPIRLLIKLGKKNGLFINPGVKIALSRGAEYSGSGTFDYEGYYSQYDITLRDLPNYGFGSGINESSSGSLSTSASVNLIASIGLFFSIGEKMELALGANYEKGLGSIVKGGSNNTLAYNTNIGPDSQTTLNSLSQTSETFSLGSLGGQISLKFYIR